MLGQQVVMEEMEMEMEPNAMRMLATSDTDNTETEPEPETETAEGIRTNEKFLLTILPRIFVRPQPLPDDKLCSSAHINIEQPTMSSSTVSYPTDINPTPSSTMGSL